METSCDPKRGAAVNQPVAFFNNFKKLNWRYTAAGAVFSTYTTGNYLDSV